MNEWLDGEDVDVESNLPHLYLAASNLAMLIEYAETCPELDDRWKGAKNQYKDSFTKHQFNSYQKVMDEDMDDMAKELGGKFKVGDRVRLIRDCCLSLEGDEGVVEFFDAKELQYKITRGENYQWVDEDAIELVNDKDLYFDGKGNTNCI